jgi:hypothetical protein
MQHGLSWRKAISRGVKSTGAAAVEASSPPRSLVVLAIGVVVAALGAAHLVARRAAWHALGQDSVASRLRFCALAQRDDAGSSVSPSTPWFQDWLSSAPSRLSSPLASLCLWL